MLTPDQWPLPFHRLSLPTHLCGTFSRSKADASCLGAQLASDRPLVPSPTPNSAAGRLTPGPQRELEEKEPKGWTWRLLFPPLCPRLSLQADATSQPTAFRLQIQ